MLKFTLPDGKELEYPQGVTPAQVVRGIGAGLFKAALAVKIDGAFVDWHSPLCRGGRVEVVTAKHPQALDVLRHSAAHVMAAAVQKLWPDAQLGFGPAREDGFHYDFVLEHRLSEADFAAIEEEMRRLVEADEPFQRETIDKEAALRWAQDGRQGFKHEAIERLGGADSEDPEAAAAAELTLYRSGDFVDLCRGPHVRSTGVIKAFTLTQVSGSFWLGDEKNPPMQRLRGTAFFSKKDQDEHFALLEEAKKRDHRRLGKDLDLFHFDERAPGFPFFHPRGAAVYKRMLDYSSWVHRKWRYQEIITPLILDVGLWHQSGHYDHYRDNMFFTRGHLVDMAVKPMNCPGCILVFNSRHHSYRELPLRLSELGRVHRMERSGVRHGLFRVQNFVQDDAHIFCTQEQIEDEVVGVLDMVEEIYRRFGFTDVSYELSTVPPEKSIVSAEVARSTEQQLARALARQGVEYRLNPGDGAFYGPKIDVHVTDALKRRWQCGTIQLDASMPGRLGAEYVDHEDQRRVPVMIHRALYGSVERFLGIVIEHCAGAFPVWLAPEQARLLPIADRHHEQALRFQKEALQADLRVEIDPRNEKIGLKIREAELAKVPNILIIGDKELAQEQVSVRRRGEGDQGARAWGEFLTDLCRQADFRRSES